VKIAVVTGSTRPGRNNEAVARWVHELARKRTDAECELVDIEDYHLPLLDEPVPASLGQYSQPHTRAWAARIAAFDAYVFVTPEYNHSTSAALKNAIDYLFREWSNKAAGFVSYGGAGGARAVEHLRLILANVMVATVQAQVMLSLFTDFDNFTTFRPDPRHEREVHTMLDQVIAWGGAMRSLRTPLPEQTVRVERRRRDYERVS
jgi:NAD(P)H-dependent FMN reductase